MHEQKVEIARVVDEESLVARRHHMAGLLVVAISDLSHHHNASAIVLPITSPHLPPSWVCVMENAP